jgi:hypothetical protein
MPNIQCQPARSARFLDSRSSFWCFKNAGTSGYCYFGSAIRRAIDNGNLGGNFRGRDAFFTPVYKSPY